ncbi:MAG: putative metalloprotease with PDZ domain [Planctomycetota bacterium]|jgi:predicted metalloprotease with PDZ domain
MLSALLLICSPLAPTLGADYLFRITDPKEELVACSAHLQGLSGPLVVGLPERFAYASPSEPRLQGEVRIGQDQGTIERTGPFSWRLEPSGSSVDLSWIVPLDHRSLPEALRSSYELPYMEADHAFLVTAVLAIAPQGPASKSTGEIRVRLELPDEWKAVVPWPEVAPGVFSPTSVTQLQNDLIAAGNWTVSRAHAAGVDLSVAIAPGQRALGPEIVEKIGAVVEREIQLFGRVPNAHYAFFFGNSEMGGLGGSVKTSSMTLLVDANMPADFVAENILHLIAHEYHHTWMQSLATPPNMDEVRFLGEGFTDFYAYLVPWWLGFDGDAKLLATLEGKLADFEVNQTARTRSLVEAGGPTFFTDPSASATVYSGGLVLALLSEIAIQRAQEEGSGTASLNHVLREFFDGPVDNASGSAGLQRLLSLLTRYAGAGFSDQANNFVNHKGAVDLLAAFAQLGLEVKRSEAPCDLSSLRANMGGTTLLGIDSSGVAQRVGLRSGDRLLMVNGKHVTTEAEVRLAWQVPEEDQIRVLFERDGEEQEIDLPRPMDIRYSLPSEVLGILRRAEANAQ